MPGLTSAPTTAGGARQGYANELANAESDEELAAMVQRIMQAEGVAPGGCWVLGGAHARLAAAA